MTEAATKATRPRTPCLGLHESDGTECWICGDGGPLLLLGEQALSHTTPQVKKQQSSVTMAPPIRRLPAASILQVSVIAVRRAIDHDHRDPAT